jgi:23S rRNA (adenine2030-N6)-methyltransferase
MNYRHAYHAGNHADVLKHVILVRILELLKAKDSPFGVLDAHAGIGHYDLSGFEAGKTFEWHTGIGKLLAAPVSGMAGELLAPYMETVRKVQFSSTMRYYPGSPELVSRLSRHKDRLYFNELHPEDYKSLEYHYAQDARIKTFCLDATTAIKSILPFSTGRGLVLIDPPFEKTDEAERVEKMLEFGLQRMAHAIFAIWYPVKDMDISARLSKFVAELAKENVLKAEVLVMDADKSGGLAGSGMIIVNPPWKLHDELNILVPELTRRLAIEKQGSGTLEWLAPPK